MFPSRLVSVLGKGALENNYSVGLDGTNDYVGVSNSSTIQDAFTGTTMTATAWIKVTGETDYPKILVKAGASGWTSPFGTFVLSLTTTSAPYNLQGWLKINTDAGVVTTDNPIALGIWYHVAMVYDGILNKLYIDGKLVDSASYTTSVPSSSYDLYIGKHQGDGEFFEGNIDEVSIWNKALSAGDISALYQARGTADLNDDGNSANLVGWWRMGDGVLDGYPLIADQVNPTLVLKVSDDAADDDTGDWSENGDDLLFDTDHYTFSSTGAGKYMVRNGVTGYTVTSGNLYKMSVDVKDGTATGQTLGFGLTDSGINYVAGSYSSVVTTSSFQTATHYVTADANEEVDFFLDITTNPSGDNIQLKNFKLEEVQGNPGLMTNMTASDIVKDTP